MTRRNLQFIITNKECLKIKKKKLKKKKKKL